MKTSEQLLSLAERVEKLDGPSREVDAEIAAAVRYFPKGVGFVWKAGLKPNSPEPGRVECETSTGTAGPHYKAPAFTASHDAAMTLVGEDGLGSIIGGKYADGRTGFAAVVTKPSRAEAEAFMPNLAVLSAYLRALANEQDRTS